MKNNIIENILLRARPYSLKENGSTHSVTHYSFKHTRQTSSLTFSFAYSMARIEGESIEYDIKKNGKFLKTKNKKIHFGNINNVDLKYKMSALKSLKKLLV